MEHSFFVCDVGGEYIPEKNRFDHHQEGYFEAFEPDSKIKMAAAGLVYRHYGK